VLPLSFDFYLPEKNLLIELDGIQHFSPIKRFGGYERFELQKKLDSIKNQWCLENKIELVRFSKIEEIKEFFFKI
jgi:very-short-patch-repair endonuclease